MTDELSKIKARLEAATPGPWHDSEMSMSKISWGGLWAETFHIAKRGADVVAVVWDPDELPGEQAANANFIAHAHTDIAALLRALELAVEHRNECYKHYYADIGADEETLNLRQLELNEEIAKALRGE